MEISLGNPQIFTVLYSFLFFPRERKETKESGSSFLSRERKEAKESGVGDCVRCAFSTIYPKCVFLLVLFLSKEKDKTR